MAVVPNLAANGSWPYIDRHITPKFDPPYHEFIPIVLDQDVARGLARGLLATAGGTVNLTDETGTARTAVPVVTGINRIAFRRITTGGSATGLFAAY